ncbi:putative transposase, partial [Pseudomonas cichorii]
MHGMTSLPDLDPMTPEQLRALAAQLMSKIDTQDRKIHRDETIIEQLTHEIAILKRHKFAKRSEQISPAQGSLLDDLLNTDLEAIEAELKALHPAPSQAEPRQQPRRAPLPPQFPRTVIHHEPDNTQCTCGCQLQRIGEDVSEKLDYTSGVFTVEQHVRGKWACRQCETLIQAPVPPHVIDKGIPTAGLLAHVMVAKFADHLPLYRQEKIFGRAGLAIPRSTLAQWVGQTGVQLQPLVDALREVVLAQRVVHADETPVQMLAPGEKKTHRAYVWAYSSTPFSALKAVVYDFSPSRAGEHARNFLGTWNGKLVCDDFAGYKASFEQGIVIVRRT